MSIGLPRLSALSVLIETSWNVKTISAYMAFQSLYVLIETSWNVKIDADRAGFLQILY